MTLAEFEFLKSDEGQNLVEQLLAERPEAVALRFRNPALASQIKFLQPSRLKLPSFFEKRCIIPPLAFEQCSSELAAESKTISGKNCLDLTCGLGVDSFWFSKNFQRVVSLERDSVLAQITAFNFEKLGVKNISVLNETAENWLKTNQNERFDWVFIDPARRGAGGQKLFKLEDCEPNFLALLPLLKTISRGILAKVSPLFDVAEAARLLPDFSKIEAVSINGEVKELLFRWHENEVGPPRVVSTVHRGVGFLSFEKREKVVGEDANNGQNRLGTAEQISDTRRSLARAEDANKGHLFEPFSVKFLLEPDGVFYKNRAVESLFQHEFSHFEGFLTSSDGFFVSQNLDKKAAAEFVGRAFRTLEAAPFQPKKWADLLKKRKIERLNVVVRSFDFSAAEVRKQLKIKEGGDLFLLLTKVENVRWAWLCERI